MARHPESFDKLIKLNLTDTIEAGGQSITLLEIGPLHRDGEGSFAWAVVIHTNPCNDYHPFAVHNLHWDDEVDHWVMSTGDYARDLDEAQEFFDRRIGTRTGRTARR